MKRSIALLAAIMFSIAAWSQEETKYLINQDGVYSGFGGMMGEVSLVRDRAIYCIGGGGGFLMNQQFFIGGYGMGNVVDGPLFEYNNVPVSYEMGHGGLWLGYYLKPQNVVHFGASSRFGWGGLGLRDEQQNLLLSDDIFLISPQLEMDINILPFMKLNFAAGYKTVLGVNNAFFKSSDLNTPYGLLGIYFGWFGGF